MSIPAPTVDLYLRRTSSLVIASLRRRFLSVMTYDIVYYRLVCLTISVMTPYDISRYIHHYSQKSILYSYSRNSTNLFLSRKVAA